MKYRSSKQWIAIVAIFILSYCTKTLNAEEAETEAPPSLTWTKERWRQEVNNLTNVKNNTEDFVTKILHVTEYTPPKFDYFDTKSVCQVTNDLLQFHQFISQDNTTLNKNLIENCLNAIGNLFSLDATDLNDAQITCNSTNRLTALLHDLMYKNHTTDMTIATRTFFAQVLPLNSTTSNVIVVYSGTKQMKKHENHKNFDFIDSWNDVEIALTFPPFATSDGILIVIYNTTHNFIHPGLVETVKDVQKQIGVYFRNAYASSNSIQFKIPLNTGSKECHKSCVKYDNLNGHFDNYFCKRPSKDFLTGALHTQNKETSVLLVQNGIDCVSYDKILNPINILHTILTLSGYVFYFVKNRVENCRRDVTVETETKPKSTRIYYVLHQLSAVTFTKYLLMLIFDIRFFEMYYAPSSSCVAIGILTHVLLLAEFYFTYLLLIIIGFHFKQRNYHICTKTLISCCLIMWFLSFAPAIISGSISFLVSGVSFYSETVCFPSLDNVYYVITVFVIPLGAFAGVVLYTFAKNVRNNTADLENVMLKYLVANIVSLFVFIMITWICFIGMIYSHRSYFTLFCIFSVLQCLCICLLYWLLEYLTQPKVAKDNFSVVYKFKENGESK